MAILPDLNPFSIGIKQFYNRFSTDSIGLLPKNAAFTPAQPYRFNVSMMFTPFSLNPISTDTSRVAQYLGINTADGLGAFSVSQSFRFLVQSIELPNIASKESTEAFSSEFGYGTFSGKYILPETNTFTINMLSTELSVHEHAFYYWLNETASQTWIYPSQPYSKATILIQNIAGATSLPTSIYMLGGCYPISIEAVKPNHNANSSGDAQTRKIIFNFNKLMIIPNVVGLASGIANAATGLLSPEPFTNGLI